MVEKDHCLFLDRYWGFVFDLTKVCSLGISLYDFNILTTLFKRLCIDWYAFLLSRRITFMTKYYLSIWWRSVAAEEWLTSTIWPFLSFSGAIFLSLSRVMIGRAEDRTRKVTRYMVSFIYIMLTRVWEKNGGRQPQKINKTQQTSGKIFKLKIWLNRGPLRKMRT